MINMKNYLNNRYVIIALILFIGVALGIAGFFIVNSGDPVIIESGVKNTNTQMKTTVQAEGRLNQDTDKGEANSNAAENTTSAKNENDKKNMIKVYVVGCVNNPGLVTLEKGQLIGDAIEAAGGATAEADIYNINLAYKLNDNAMIKIKAKGEAGQNTDGSVAENSSVDIVYDAGSGVTIDYGDSSGALSTSGSSSKAGSGESKKININAATLEELDSLSGIGEATAKAIIEYREKNGGFKTIEEIMNVSGIKENKFNRIKDSICVE